MARQSMAKVQIFDWTSLRTRAFSSAEASIPSIRNILARFVLFKEFGNTREKRQE